MSTATAKTTGAAPAARGPTAAGVALIGIAPALHANTRPGGRKCKGTRQ